MIAGPGHRGTSLAGHAACRDSVPDRTGCPRHLCKRPNQAAVQNADGTLNTPDNPAAAGSVITVYLTGQGAVEPPVATAAPAPSDPLARAAYPVTATIGGQPAAVTFAGLSPGSVGLFQVNLRLPLIGSGSYPLEVSVNGISSNTRLVTVSQSR